MTRRNAESPAAAIVALAASVLPEARTLWRLLFGLYADPATGCLSIPDKEAGAISNLVDRVFANGEHFGDEERTAALEVRLTAARRAGRTAEAASIEQRIIVLRKRTQASKGGG